MPDPRNLFRVNMLHAEAVTDETELHPGAVITIDHDFFGFYQQRRQARIRAVQRHFVAFGENKAPKVPGREGATAAGAAAVAAHGLRGAVREEVDAPAAARADARRPHRGRAQRSLRGGAESSRLLPRRLRRREVDRRCVSTLGACGAGPLGPSSHPVPGRVPSWRRRHLRDGDGAFRSAHATASPP
jgi:hypothetical protein